MKLGLEEIEKIIIEAGSDNLGVFGGHYEGGIHCQQIPDELAPCIKAIIESRKRIQSYLEIGAAAGGTAYLFNHFFALKQVVLIDDNKHPKARLRGNILKDIKHNEIIGSSHDVESISKASEFAPYDIILIDGDHHYANVKLDTIFYSPLLRVGGFLILHDSALPEWGVGRTVMELKNDDSMKFIAEYKSQKHKPCGLALFQKVSR